MTKVLARSEGGSIREFDSTNSLDTRCWFCMQGSLEAKTNPEGTAYLACTNCSNQYEVLEVIKERQPSGGLNVCRDNAAERPRTDA
jgi:hypothetical protein